MWAWDLDCWVILNMGNPCVFRKGEIEIYSPACPSGVFDRHKSVSGMKFQTSCIQINYSLQLEKDSHFFMENFRHSSIFQIITSSSCDFSSKRQPRKKKRLTSIFTNPRSTCPILLWRFHQKNPWPLSGWSLVPRLKAARHSYPPARTKRAHEAKKLGKNLYGIHWIPWLFDDGILTNGLW